MKKCLNDDFFFTISAILEEESLEGYVIGGYVRDALLGRTSKDIDIVVVGNGIHLAKRVSKQLGNISVSVFKNFGTAMIKYKGLEIEFVGARKESYRYDSRKPMVENGTLEDDQKRRDFTINAMAFGLNKKNFGELVDPFDGRAHLQQKLIKTPLEPNITFSDDPLRMIRAIRFATQLDFKIDQSTFEAIISNSHRISILSAERITDEFNKMMMGSKPSRGFRLLSDSGLLQKFLPEVEALKGVEERQGIRHKDNFYHTIQVLDNISEQSGDLWLRWATLFHDIGKPKTKQFHSELGWTFHGHDFIGGKMVPVIFKRMRLPMNDKMKYVKKLVELHLRPMNLATDEVSDSAVRRLLFEAGDDIDDLMMLCEADITSQNEKLKRQYLRNFKKVREKLKEIEEKDAIRNFQPPISGDDIMEAFKIKPCKEVGIIKNTIKDAILDGEIRNDYQEAYELMVKKGKELGLSLQTGKSSV